MFGATNIYYGEPQKIKDLMVWDCLKRRLDTIFAQIIECPTPARRCGVYRNKGQKSLGNQFLDSPRLQISIFRGSLSQ
jgi:hypothetical protein